MRFLVTSNGVSKTDPDARIKLCAGKKPSGRLVERGGGATGGGMVNWLNGYFVKLLNRSWAAACDVLIAPGQAGPVLKSSRNFKFVPEGRQGMRRKWAGWGSARVLAGRQSWMVITTIIREEFSRGPWTKAVQGPK